MQCKTIVFDVNETLLDLSSLDPLFEKHFGSSKFRDIWFREMLITAMTLNHIGKYAHFTEIGQACLSLVAGYSKKPIDASVIDEIMTAIRTLPPHSDVLPAFEKLSSSELKLAALTNSPSFAAETQLSHAGLIPYFSQIISVSDIGVLKPANQVYIHAAKSLNNKGDQITLVASHTWDTAGAAACGWRTALVTRGGTKPHPLYRQPDIVEPTLTAIANAIANE